MNSKNSLVVENISFPDDEIGHLSENELQEEILSLKGQIAYYNQLLTAIIEKNEDLENEVQKLAFQIEILDEEINKLELLNQENEADYKEKLNEYTEINEKIQTSIQSKIEENQLINEKKVIQINENIFQLNNKIQQLHNEIEQLQNETYKQCQENEEKISSLRQTLTTLKDKQTTLKRNSKQKKGAKEIIMKLIKGHDNIVVLKEDLLLDPFENKISDKIKIKMKQKELIIQMNQSEDFEQIYEECFQLTQQSTEDLQKIEGELLWENQFCFVISPRISSKSFKFKEEKAQQKRSCDSCQIM